MKHVDVVVTPQSGNGVVAAAALARMMTMNTMIPEGVT